tara:strand:+ start:157 stop:510 length:354 start_codon:yes stop_codon:yes gene_type:complete
MSTLIRDGGRTFRLTKNRLGKLTAQAKKAQLRLVPTLNGFRVIDLLNPVATNREVANSTVPYDYTDIYGIVWNNAQVDRYNALQDRINAFENKSLPVPPELEMESHKAYQSPYYGEQ